MKTHVKKLNKHMVWYGRPGPNKFDNIHKTKAQFIRQFNITG